MSNSRRTAALLLSAFCLLPSAFLTAQQVFRSGTQVIEVYARVFRSDGTFVTDLTAADFEVLEDGVPQAIVALTLVDRSPVSPASSALPGPPASPVPSGLPALPASPATWIFFFDLPHLTPGTGFRNARAAAAAFVRERFREGDMAGVIDGKGMVNGRLTSNRDEIVKAIESVTPNSEARGRSLQLTREWPRLLDEDEAVRITQNNRDAMDAAVRRACTDRPEMCQLGADPQGYVREKAQRVITDMRAATLETLKTAGALANGLARMTGPKTIVFLSEGFVATGMETAVRTIVGQTARAGARVYAIDVRGLQRTGDNLDQAAATDAAGGVMSFDTKADGFNSLAVDTGGLMIRNQNNFNRALDTIASDANRYYVIGYQTANTTFDGKYRSIEVRVKKPGTNVRARRGYLALPPSQMLVPQRESGAPDPAAGVEGAAGSAGPAPPAAASTPAAAVALIETASIRERPEAGDRVRALSRGHEADANADARAGWEAYQKGDLETALPHLTRAAESGGEAWVHYALGLTRAGLADLDSALTAWERVRQIEPGYSQVYNDLAATYAARGRLSDALEVLRDAARRWPEDADFHNGIGVILVRRDALDDAIAAFTKAVEAARDEPLTHLNLGRAYELRYMRNMRFISSQKRWVAPEGDRRKAAQAYQRCIDLGGPYARQASAALGRLEWEGDK